MESPACAELPIPHEHDAITEYFVGRLGQIAYDRGLDLSGWEDAFLRSRDETINRTNLVNDEVYAYAWNNAFHLGNGKKAYVLANDNFKVYLYSTEHIWTGLGVYVCIYSKCPL